MLLGQLQPESLAQAAMFSAIAGTHVRGITDRVLTWS